MLLPAIRSASKVFELESITNISFHTTLLAMLVFCRTIQKKSNFDLCPGKTQSTPLITL